MSKKTAILGASTNPTRYAYLAAERLTSHDHEIVPIAIKSGTVFGKEILDLKTKPEVGDIDTVTMYIGPQNQAEWEDYILSLHPKRIIFNPGTENPPFAQKAADKGIEVENACTLVLLGNGLY
ncbi:MAG: CoA-binding protein [Ekhidna sp.]|uniref:CoA-binding protein n=1 Tax=Ekhidna sp. TaxID=2608089 RepID=UPI0032EE075C